MDASARRLSRGERRARRQALAEMPDLIEVVIVAVRAGRTPAAALVTASWSGSALRPTLDELALRLARGARLADAVSAFPDLLGPQAAGFADALGTADRYGIPLEPVLDRLAADARAQRRQHNEQHARTLPVRLAFPLVVCTLPAFALLAIVPALLGAVSTLRGLTP